MHTVSKVPTYPPRFEYWSWKGIQNQCRRMTRRGLSASFAFPLTTSLSEPSFCAGCTSTWTLEWRREREAAKSERDDKTIDGPDRRRTMNGQPENPRSGGVESKNPSSGGNEGGGESEADSKRCGQKAAVFLRLFFTAFCYCPYLHTERQGQFGSRVHLHSASLRFTLHPKESQWGGSSADSPAPKPKKKRYLSKGKHPIRAARISSRMAWIFDELSFTFFALGTNCNKYSEPQKCNRQKQTKEKSRVSRWVRNGSILPKAGDAMVEVRNYIFTLRTMDALKDLNLHMSEI